MITETSLTPDIAERLRVRVRPDLVVRTQLYEGRTHYVVKDPVGLRYFRFKEEEYFLLKKLDGNHRLEEVRQDYEREFPPQKITIEELARFASQLTQAGIAGVDTSGQGQVLYERFRKQRFRKRLAAWTNVLYIKVPVFDPDKLLGWMVPYFRWIYHPLVVAMTILLWGCAGLWVIAHYDRLQARLPEFYTFFNWRNIFFMWLALGVVKVIHEFGHGLTCKYFGGECHEMGFLMLVLSPCLYCDVSDSWLLPNKWHRVYIGAAGIYVELTVAAIASIVWWNTDTGTLINNLCLSTMFICSVNTVLFNGNPLLRFDGYFILMDIMEIPNLRAKAARFFSSLFGKWCLGLPTDMETYLPRARRVFFVIFAIASYVYRWFITFAILWFLYRFLRPYKLATLSTLLAMASVATLVAVPSYQLGKFIWEYRRTSTVSKLRLTCTLVVFAILAGLFLFLPVPWSVKASLITRPQRPEYVWVEVPGELEALHVIDGQSVKQNDVLARLRNDDKQEELLRLEGQMKQHEILAVAYTHAGRLADAADEREQALQTARQVESIQEELQKLKLLAPCDGTVMQPPKPEERGSFLDLGTGKPFCKIGDESRLEALVLIDQKDKDLVRQGQNVELLIFGHALKTVPGTIEIPIVDVDALPPELSNVAGGNVPTRADEQTGQHKPIHTLYYAVVAIDNSAGLFQPGLRGIAKIDGDRIPLATRFWRWVRHLFAFET